MKNTWKSLLVAGAMTLSLTSSAFAATPATLSDINNSYAKDQITKLYNAGLITGDENHHYNPTRTMTREQLAIVLSKALGLTPDATVDGTFTDVADWAKPYVGALVKAGIASGYDAKTFGGNDPVTREQLAIFFVRAFGATDLTGQLNLQTTDFSDGYQIDGYALPYVAVMEKLGFLNGYSTAYGMEFNPKGNADRQAVAHLVSEFYFNKNTYTRKLDNIKTDVDLMKQSDQAMQSIQSATVTVSGTSSPVSTQIPSLTDTVDFTVSPLTAHGTVKLTPAPGSQDLPQSGEWYLENGIMYTQENQSDKWVKADVSSNLKDLTDSITGSALNDSILSDYSLAPDYTLTSDATTDTLTHYLPDILGTDSQGNSLGTGMTYTIILDKQTHLVKSISNVLKDRNSSDITLTTFDHYNALQPIVVPQTIKDTATWQQDTSGTTTPAAAQDLQHLKSLLSR